MRRVMTLSLAAVLALMPCAAMAQSPEQSMYGAAGMPGLGKNSVSDSMKLAIEMLLLYKLLGQPSMISTDGGIVVLFGSKISKYDKDLNLIKQVDLTLDIDSMKELVSKVADSYSKELMSSMGSMTGNLLQAKMSSNDALAKATLRAISTASESYQTANNGVYPSSISDLTLATPAYLNTNYCEHEIAGYYYSCDFKASGYKITATPAKKGITGSTGYSISTGGVLQP